MTKRKNHSPDSKAKVALEAIHEETWIQTSSVTVDLKAAISLARNVSTTLRQWFLDFRLGFLWLVLAG
jgi:hypothetical protein